jgi:hypothetical protein
MRKQSTERQENRGRPRIYQYSDRRQMAELIREHGARGARDVLFKQTCLNTLLAIAREFRIELKKGRRPRKAAA